MSETVLELSEVEAGYGQIGVLKKVSLKVNKGEIVSIIGANGAGKTTTLMCLSGINRARKGTIRLFGEDITNAQPHSLVGKGMAHVPEGRKIFSRLTVKENLTLGAYLRTDSQEIADNLEKVYSLFPILKDRQSQQGGTLSGGEQQMLAIGRALMSNPSVLLMDEPSMGVAPMIVQKIFKTIRTLNEDGITILLVEQNAHLALAISNRGYVLETGAISLEDTSERLLSNPKIQEAYLGEG